MNSTSLKSTLKSRFATSSCLTAASYTSPLQTVKGFFAGGGKPYGDGGRCGSFRFPNKVILSLFLLYFS
jgi:hypothetical protein